MSGSENPNSSPRYCPTPTHQIPGSASPPPQIMHHMQSQSMGSYYSYHNSQSAASQQNYYSPTQSTPNPGYYGAMNPHQTQYVQAPQWPQQQQQQQHVHQTGYYGHPYVPPPQPNYASHSPQHSPHLQQQQQQQQLNVTGSAPISASVGQYDMSLTQIGSPSNHTLTQNHQQQQQHVVPNSDSSIMNLARFVNQNQNNPPPMQQNLSVNNNNIVMSGESISPRPEPRSPPVVIPPLPTTIPVLPSSTVLLPSPSVSSSTAVTTTTSVVNAANGSGGGQTGMMPVRLQNMAKGARTKASMRKLLLEQQSTVNSNSVEIPSSESSSDDLPKKRGRRKRKSSELSEKVSSNEKVASTPTIEAKKTRKSKMDKNEKSAPTITEATPSPSSKKQLPKPRGRTPSKSPAKSSTPVTEPTPPDKMTKSLDTDNVLTNKSSPITIPNNDVVVAVATVPKRNPRGRKPAQVADISPPSPTIVQQQQQAPPEPRKFEEEIAFVLLDLKTGKSSPEKEKEKGKLNKGEEQDSVSKGEQVASSTSSKGRKRKSPIKPVDIDVPIVNNPPETTPTRGRAKKGEKRKSHPSPDITSNPNSRMSGNTKETAAPPPTKRKYVKKSLTENLHAGNNNNEDKNEASPSSSTTPLILKRSKAKKKNEKVSKSEIPSTATPSSSFVKSNADISSLSIGDNMPEEFPVLSIPEDGPSSAIIVETTTPLTTIVEPPSITPKKSKRSYTKKGANKIPPDQETIKTSPNTKSKASPKTSKNKKLQENKKSPTKQEPPSATSSPIATVAVKNSKGKKKNASKLNISDSTSTIIHSNISSNIGHDDNAGEEFPVLSIPEDGPSSAIIVETTTPLTIVELPPPTKKSKRSYAKKGANKTPPSDQVTIQVSPTPKSKAPPKTSKNKKIQENNIKSPLKQEILGAPSTELIVIKRSKSKKKSITKLDSSESSTIVHANISSSMGQVDNMTEEFPVLSIPEDGPSSAIIVETTTPLTIVESPATAKKSKRSYVKKTSTKAAIVEDEVTKTPVVPKSPSKKSKKSQGDPSSPSKQGESSTPVMDWNKTPKENDNLGTSFTKIEGDVKPTPSPGTPSLKKKLSRAAKQEVDKRENETIMEVSLAHDKPLPPLSHFLQFEYSQRNNYPPSIPSSQKRKEHRLLEAQKNELQQSTPTGDPVKLSTPLPLPISTAPSTSTPVTTTTSSSSSTTSKNRKDSHRLLEARKNEIMAEIESGHINISVSPSVLPTPPPTSSTTTTTTSKNRKDSHRLLEARKNEIMAGLSPTTKVSTPPSVKNRKESHRLLEARKNEIMAEINQSLNASSSTFGQEQVTPSSSTLPSSSSSTAVRPSSPTSTIQFIPALVKPLKTPSVFIKSIPLAATNSKQSSQSKAKPEVSTGKGGKKQQGKKDKKGEGLTVENKGKGQKNLTRVGPNLRVKNGAVKFYRGSDEEDMDIPLSKLRLERPSDAYDTSVPWVCTFCRLGPHAQRLGDLFGPYYVKLPTAQTANGQLETWMHQDCALWAGGVILIGVTVRGLDQAVGAANLTTCTMCHEKGATIGCLRRKCQQAAHFPCAQKSLWKLDNETFHSYCQEHS